MAKENENQTEANAPLVPSTNQAEMDDNKENEGVDNKNSCDTEKLDVKSETKSDLKSSVPPSADIEKVTSDLLKSRTDLLGRVQNLKKEEVVVELQDLQFHEKQDLQDWRGKLDSQVKTYRQELGELRTTLNSEVEQLRTEFQALRTTLKRQLDVTNGLAELGPNTSTEKATA